MKGNPFTRAVSARKTCASLLTAATLTVAPLASASSMAPSLDSEGWGAALGFVGCAVGIVVASGTLQVWLAGLACARVMAVQLGI